MKCRKVEPSVVMNSARLVQRPQEKNNLEEEIVDIVTSPEKKSPNFNKTLKRATSGPIINLQQQIIIQSGPPAKESKLQPSQKSPIKKKKKKKRVQKKKKITTTVEKLESEQRVQSLLKHNLKKYYRQKQEEKLQEQLQKQRVVSFNEMRKLMDQQIRQVNHQRFTRQKSPPSSMLPWGVDQTKLKTYWTKMLEIHDKLDKPQQHNSTATEFAIKEKIRRHKLGLDFLNSKPEREIQRMIQKQKSKQLLDTITSPQKKKSSCENKEAEQDVKLYMMYKRELWKQQKIEEKQLEKLKKEKLIQNLQILDQEAKLFAKSRNASIKSNLTGQASSQHGQQPISQHHHKTSEPISQNNQLEKEYQQYLKLHRHSNSTSNKKINQNKFIEWLQNLSESYLEEQLQQIQQINEQMNHQGFNYKLNEQEVSQFLEQFLKEQFQQQQQQLSPHNQQQQNSPEKSHSSSLKNPQSSYQNQITEKSSLSQKEESLNELNEQQLQEIENIAATIIQKVWRGYKTRQVVFEYLQYLIQQQEDEEHDQQFKEQFDGISQQEEVKSLQEATNTDRKLNPLDLQISDQSPIVQGVPPQSLQSQQSKSSPRVNTSIPPLNFEQFSSSSPKSPNKQKQNDQILSQSQSQVQATTPQKSIHSQNGFNTDPEYFMQVIKLREDALDQKYEKQITLLQKMLEKKKVSNELFSENKEKLDRKLKREKDKLQQSKNEIERLHQMFKETIKSTQKDQQFMERMKFQQDEENLSIRQIFSIRSETEQSDGEFDKKSIPHYGLLRQIKNDHFRKKNRKQVRSFDQQVSLDEISMKNEEIQTSTLYNVHTESMSQSLHKSQQLPTTNQQSIPSQQEVLQIEPILIIEPQILPISDKNSKIIIPFDDRKIDNVTENIVQAIILEFAEELNNFPLQSLGVLMEWDEESQIEIQFPPGFQTTLNFIKDYLIAFSEYIQKNYMEIFLQQINTPLGITPQDLLKTISLSDMQQNALDDSTSGPLYPLIKHIHQMEPLIDEEIWTKFNTFYSAKLKYYNELTENEQYKELEIFHLRMIYEAFNEAINYVRPYGIRGQPYPWKANPLKTYQNQTTNETVDRAMGFAIAKMLKWGSFLCGFIPEKIETPQGEVIVIEDDYLNQIKEDRLQQMLEYEIQESEEKWLNYDEEQAEVAVELADIVFETMLDEAAEELFKITQKSSQKI